MHASNKRINGHGHLLPYPKDIPAFMKAREIFWVDDDQKYMRQKGWKRPITDASFFLEEKRSWMKKNNIAHEVVLNLSQLYCNGLDRQTTRDAIRFQNDFNASVQHRYPDEFTCGFVLQPAFLDDALREMERCVQEYGLRLLCLPTHYATENGVWKSVADLELNPLFEQADKLGLAMEIHPYDGPKFIALEDEFWRFHLVWMMAQTADAYHRYTLLSMHERFPNIRLCFAHGNQFGQVNIGRREQGYKGRPDLFKNAQSPIDAVGAPNLFFDTLVHDVLSFEMLVRRQGLDQIVAGLDDPYPLGEMESVAGCYPGIVLDQAVDSGVIDDSGRAQIWCDNVLRWLGDARGNEIRKSLGIGV